MKTVLVFDTELTGHHLEYLHHLYLKAGSSNDKYIFCVPSEFEQKKEKFEWNFKDNIIVDYLDTKDCLELAKCNKLYKRTIKKCQILRNVTKKHNPTHVFLIHLISFLPFIGLYLSNTVKVSGIIYQIYLYRWKCSSIVGKFLDVIKFIIMTNTNCIDRIYLLNDFAAPRIINRLYKTSKFYFLPDPFVPIENLDSELDRDVLNIPDRNVVFLHFGSLSYRKGSLEILKALNYIDDKNNVTFIFAGKVNSEIKDEFYQLYNNVKNNIHTILIDEFCRYESLASLCVLSDYLLMPYKHIGQSSGVIGYAAQFKTPVIGPNKGLIGKLIRRYKLGITLDDTSCYSIANYINRLDRQQKVVCQSYLASNNVNSFISSISFDV